MQIKKKIIVFTTYMDRRPARGTAVFIREFVNELLKKRDAFEITLAHHEPIPEDDVYIKCDKEIVFPKVNLPRGGRLISEALFYLFHAKEYDFAYFAYPRIHPLFFLLRARVKASMQFDGGPETSEYPLQATVGKVSVITGFLMRRFIDFFVVTSEFGQRGIAKKLQVSTDRVLVSYGAAAPIFGSFSKQESKAFLKANYQIDERPIIMGSGRLDPHKNIHRLVEAFAVVKSDPRFSGIQLVVTGGVHMPEYSAMVLKMIDDLGLQNDVKIVQVRHDHEMPFFYSASETMVFPSLYEGFGLPMVEAMLSGIPIVAARGTSLTEVGGNAVEFVDPQEPSDIARGIIAVMSDQGYASSLSAKGKQRASIFTWGAHTEAILDKFLLLN